MESAARAGGLVPAATAALAVGLRLDKHGPQVAKERVLEGDLSDPEAELWLASHLRKGCPDVPLRELDVRLIPVLEKQGHASCAGFLLQTTNPAGQPTTLHFSIFSLAHVADRASRRLLADGALKPGETYYYEVLAEPATDHQPAAAPKAPAFTITARSPALTYMTVPLPPLLAAAEAVGPSDHDGCPVLYTRAAFEAAERFARKGAAFDEPTETGAVLLGPLCSCPDTGEFFVVVVDAIEPVAAEQTKFSLTYSGHTWAMLQRIVRARQSQPATRAHRILGQCHGHNFLPDDGKDCRACPKRDACTLTSVFVSPHDRQWTRAVFAHQPWGFCHIYGNNARGQKVNTLFGLRDGQLQERGFHVIADFQPGEP